jgi:hypothetical protein
MGRSSAAVEADGLGAEELAGGDGWDPDVEGAAIDAEGEGPGGGHEQRGETERHDGDGGGWSRGSARHLPGEHT